MRPNTASRLELDQARLLPRYRDQQPVLRAVAFVDDPLEPSNTTIVPSPGELRGIPVIGHGGAIPGSQPGNLE